VLISGRNAEALDGLLVARDQLESGRISRAVAAAPHVELEVGCRLRRNGARRPRPAGAAARPRAAHCARRRHGGRVLTRASRWASACTVTVITTVAPGRVAEAD